MITLKQITYILAVEKTKHFKKAADLCAVSQSALSTAITELEKHLGLQIFERDNKKVLVTPEGASILAKAHRIKIEVDDLYQLTQANKAPFSYPMSLGAIPSVGPFLFPKTLPKVRELYPDFKLRIVEEKSHVLVDRVRSGDLDSAILALPFPLEGLLSFEFWQEDFYWVAHKDNALSAKPQITNKDLRDQPLMLLEDGHCLKEHALAVCKISRMESAENFSGASLYTLIQMAAGKMGSTLVPQMAIDQLLAGSSELKAIHLNEPGPHRSIAFIVRPNFAGVSNIQKLMNIFNQELRVHCAQ